MQPKLEPKGTKSEGIELMPKQIETEDTKLVPYQTEHEEPKLHLVQLKLQSKKPELDIEVSKAKELVFKKYVRRHHAPNQIIGDKSKGTMTRSKLKGTCLLAYFEPINVRDALDNDS